MGLGKSIITLTAVNSLMYDYFSVRRVLIIAPKKVAESTWTAEAQKWDHTRHLTFSKVLGSEKERIKALQQPADIYLINRENIKWLIDDYCTKVLKYWPFDMVVIDELSSFKNPKAKRFRAMKRINPSRVVGLTGTPAANSLLDLWAETYLLDKGEHLGKTYSSYRSRYFVPDKRSAYQIFSYKPREGALEQITHQLSGITVTMKQEDYLELPEIVYNEIPVDLGPEARNTYHSMAKDQLAVFQDALSGETTEVAALQAGAVINKLLQLANGFIYDKDKIPHPLHQAKLDALDEIYEDQKDTNPLLVFYNFQADKQALLSRFPDVRILKTDQDIRDWNQGKIPMLLAHPASVGYGLNLQEGGHIIIWYGLTWSLEQYTQANARLFRQGQKHTVVIQHLIARDTVDESVISRLQSKNTTQNDLLDLLKEQSMKEQTQNHNTGKYQNTYSAI